jgi:hypothetical protein
MSFLNVIADINIAQDVDIDGLRRSAGGRSGSSSQVEYLDSVSQARFLLRSLEVSAQALYECGTSMLLTALSAASHWALSDQPERAQTVEALCRSDSTLINESQQVSVILQNLTEVSKRQLEFADRQDFRGSMEWSSNHFSVLGGGGGQRFSKLFDNLREEDVDEGEDVVDMNFALGKASARPTLPVAEGLTDLSAPIPEEPEPETISEIVNQIADRAPEDEVVEDALTQPSAPPSAPVRPAEEEPPASNNNKSKSYVSCVRNHSRF